MKRGSLFATIVVVDDEPAFVRSARAVLQSAGYVVRSAPDGQAALDMLKARPPDLVVLGVALPGMDGYQVVRRIKADA